jgi:antitoxin component YwqK of YwqJK toxin-antitoxin module
MAYPVRTVDATPENSPEAATPGRPATVPETGVWNAEVGKWEVVRRDARGERDGECLLYRADGTLYSRAQFFAGVQEGPFFVYHRDGSVARDGTYVSGRVDGVITAYASQDPAGEKIRACCVPPGAARLCERYAAGEFLFEVFYDPEGRALLADGRLCPARPAGVSDLAQFEESRGGWALRSRTLDRVWDANGVLLQEIENPRSPVRTVRRFESGGSLIQETGFTSESRPQGPAYRRFSDAEPSPYADRRIRQERGAYEGGQAVGSWSFLDGDGAVVRTVERGVAFLEGGDARSPAFEDACDDWMARARSLASDGRVREALVAAARGAVAARDRAPFDELRAAHVVALAPEREAQWGETLAQSTDATVASILDALIGGADAPAALRALASVLPGSRPVAMDMVEASLLLAADRHATHLTRALLRLQRGDQAGALADADVIGAASPDAAASLRSYAAIVFRGFDEWPGGRTFAPDPELAGVTLEIGHAVDEIQRVAGVYATRLGRARDAIRALAGDGADGAWVPPDVSHLLPSGPVDLMHDTVECEPDPEAAPGAEVEKVEIDEELTTDGAGVPSLLAAAHADWAALSWLCWSVGLDRVALPETVTVPGDCALAMKQIVQRTWRIKDRLSTGSLLSRSQGVPGFEWQGVDIDALPRPLAEVAAAEFIAVRSMFLWLASPDTVTPFQDDLRDA